MKCQKCGVKEATTHVKRTVNGNSAEYHLCSECAGEMGYENIFSGMSFNLNNFFGSFLGEGTKPAHGAVSQRHCSLCGSSFEDIAESGKVGCAECYTTFYDRLLPSLQRIHGRTEHSGKIPASAGPKAKKIKQLEELKGKMSAAVNEQNFEEAARLRDEIKKLEEEA